MNIQEITLESIDMLVPLFIDTFNAPPWNDRWTEETAAKRLKQMAGSPAFYGLASYEGSALLGLILGHEEQFYNGAVFHIREFCVNHRLKQHGIGSMLLAELERRLKEKGIARLQLYTSRENGTEGFYHKKGFHTLSGMVLMEKDLL